MFGFAALSSGHIAVIDIEDFDAPCRRPAQANPAPVEDFRGCAGDPELEGGTFTDPETSKPTVSDEASCRVVDPHRARSADLIAATSGIGVHAPSLRTFPRLYAADGSSLLVDTSEEGLETPRLLPVEFADPSDPALSVPAQVHVGTKLYERDAIDSALDLDPATAEQNALLLVLKQPRSHPSQNEVTATYQGAIMGERTAGLLRLVGTAAAEQASDEPAGHRIEDADGRFCNRGVHDAELTRSVGVELGVDESLGLVQLSRFRDIPVGRFIYRQDTCEAGEDSIFIVLRGSVVLQARVREALEIETERLGPGELFGGLPLLADVTHAESAVAADDTRLIEIDREAFRYLRLAKPWLGYRLAQALLRISASRLRALFARLQDEL